MTSFPASGEEQGAAVSLLKRFLRRLMQYSPLQVQRRVVTRTRVTLRGDSAPADVVQTSTGREALPEEMREALDSARGSRPGAKIELRGGGEKPAVSLTFKGKSGARRRGSPDDAPPEIHRLLEEMKKKSAKNGGITVKIDGRERTYDSLEELPPEIRDLIESSRKGKSP